MIPVYFIRKKKRKRTKKNHVFVPPTCFYLSAHSFIWLTSSEQAPLVQGTDDINNDMRLIIQVILNHTNHNTRTTKCSGLTIWFKQFFDIMSPRLDLAIGQQYLDIARL